MKHLYCAFWRPDVLAGMQALQSRGAAVCEYVGPTTDMTCDTRDYDCPACRETFLAALPTGNGQKLTWFEYLSSPQAAPVKTLKDRSAEMDKAAAQWSTVQPKLPVDGWSTTTTPAPADGWSTAAPKSDGWSTKR